MSSRLDPLVTRKKEHLKTCLEFDVQSPTDSGWNAIRLPHCAVPDANCSIVDLHTDIFGLGLEAPFLISSMTGGSSDGEDLNLRLARLADERGVAMGVGSQRVALESRDSCFFALRKTAPRAVLFANLGVVQLNYGVTPEDCTWLVDQLEANAFILHANPLQEAIQAEGDRNFSNLWSKVSTLKKYLKVPIILKETGCGLDASTCRRALESGIDALDSSGLGGTHWGLVEGLRNPDRLELGKLFSGWGIPSVESLKICLAASSGRVPVIASGGLRSGLDVAKSIWLGATLGGMALPFLEAAVKGEDFLNRFYDFHVEALRVATFCTGYSSVKDLRQQA